MKKLLSAFALSAITLGCGHTPPPPPEGETCQSACFRARQLGCAWGRPTPAGVTCEELCEWTQDTFDYDLKCMSRAESCQAVDECNR